MMSLCDVIYQICVCFEEEGEIFAEKVMPAILH
jgi:hypothetical protein